MREEPVTTSGPGMGAIVISACSDISLLEQQVSAMTGAGVYGLKEALSRIIPSHDDKRLLSDLVKPGETAILVCPIDESAPKGRLILPQQQAIRDLLDTGALALVCRETELRDALDSLRKPPALVVTDSQVFRQVSDSLPREVHRYEKKDLVFIKITLP